MKFKKVLLSVFSLTLVALLIIACGEPDGVALAPGPFNAYVEPSEACVGDTIKQRVEGFESNQKVRLFFIYPDGKKESIDRQTESDGSYEHPYTVKSNIPSPSDEYGFYASTLPQKEDEHPLETNVTKYTLFNPKPKVEVKPRGSLNMTIEFLGSGFIPRTNVHVLIKKGKTYTLNQTCQGDFACLKERMEVVNDQDIKSDSKGNFKCCKYKRGLDFHNDVILYEFQDGKCPNAVYQGAYQFNNPAGAIIKLGGLSVEVEPTYTPIPPTLTPTPTDTPTPTATNTPTPTSVPTNTPIPPTATPVPTNTPAPPTVTSVPTNTPLVPPTPVILSGVWIGTITSSNSGKCSGSSSGEIFLTIAGSDIIGAGRKLGEVDSNLNVLLLEPLYGTCNGAKVTGEDIHYRGAIREESGALIMEAEGQGELCGCITHRHFSLTKDDDLLPPPVENK